MTLDTRKEKEMFLIGLLGRGVDKLEKAKEKTLDDLFARRGCSQADLRARIELAKRKGEALQERINAKEKKHEWEKRPGKATCP